MIFIAVEEHLQWFKSLISIGLLMDRLYGLTWYSWVEHAYTYNMANQRGRAFQLP